jgi:hypothetical protein
MDALLYSLAIATLGALGVAGRWADRHIAAGGRHRRLAQLVLKIALGAYYLAFALGVATAIYAVGTSPAIQVCATLPCAP